MRVQWDLMNSSEITVVVYLITRLKEIWVDHLFDVLVDFVSPYLNQGNGVV